MQSIQIAVGDGCWPDLAEKQAEGKLIHEKLLAERPMQILVIPGGMPSGAPSVAIRIDLEDGRTIITETSLAALIGTCKMFEVQYGKQIPQKAAT